MRNVLLLTRAILNTAEVRFLVRSRSISTYQLNGVPTLPDATLETFRAHAFQPGQPMLLPAGHFSQLPAASKWFANAASPTDHPSLSTEYLTPYAETIVPLEATLRSDNGSVSFSRSEEPFGIFLAFLNAAQTRRGHPTDGGTHPSVTLYVAQCPLPSLPRALLADLPTPPYVTSSGRGDIYSSSIWLGLAPTYTSLHKDPNPNLFVQLAGKKVVRIFEPGVGAELFAEARRRVGSGDGGRAGAQIRGEEMMVGEEKNVLEEMVWEDGALGGEGRVLGQEATLNGGDGIFIPKGWWHSIKGVGEGVVGSVNWWFR